MIISLEAVTSPNYYPLHISNFIDLCKISFKKLCLAIFLEFLSLDTFICYHLDTVYMRGIKSNKGKL